MTRRYFLADQYHEGQQEVTVTGEIHHHLAQVLRAQNNEEVFLVFSGEESFLSQIKEITSSQVIFKLIAPEITQKELPIKVTIASALPKGDKLSFITQKATELGMANLIAFPSDFSNVKWDADKRKKKQQRLEKIAQAAAEQSGRTHQPAIKIVKDVKELLRHFLEYDLIIVADEEKAKKNSNLPQLFNQISPNKKILAIFGAEGGFSNSERELFQKNKANLVGMGPRIMRCETAPLYFLSVVSFVWELGGGVNNESCG
jgi:16S rRNA (uracil1498-N3)-methyltransferase